ncbi:MAG: hypothetical protein EBS32_11860, partial [Actinobacteria bacterium]|nr:hypothetical protein [Actinomycetota bacterium]
MTRQRHSRIVVALAGLAAVFVALPLVGVALRMPWSGAWDVLSTGSVRTATPTSGRATNTAARPARATT